MQGVKLYCTNFNPSLNSMKQKSAPSLCIPKMESETPSAPLCKRGRGGSVPGQWAHLASLVLDCRDGLGQAGRSLSEMDRPSTSSQSNLNDHEAIDAAQQPTRSVY